MFNDFKIVLDPPPHGFYTFEDNVFGKVIFESSHEGKLGWVYVFFHGWVNVEIIRLSQAGGPYIGDPNQQKWGDKSNDKEILFQNHLKIYEGYEKLRKKTRYEWPFKFSFQAATSSAYNLPSSGHYSFTTDRNWWSSVKYKVVAVHGEISQRDDDIRWMLDPQDPRYLKGPPLKPTGIFLKIKEKLGGATEQELAFVQIRASAAIDQWMPPPRKWDLYIEAKHVPQLAPPARYDDLQVRRTTFPFSIDLQIPANIVIGEPFIVLLSVSSSSNIWNQNPPTVKLTSFKITCYILDIVTIGAQREDEKLKFRTVWEGKRLNIPLSAQPVNIGKIYSFIIEGEDFIQSFDTQILHREYSFPVELTVEVGGKSFEARYTNRRITVLSPIVATGGRMLQTQPGEDFKPDFNHDPKRRFGEDSVKFQLQGSYIGRLSHVGAGLDRPLAEHSMMEAAIALSRTMTGAGIQHTFPGGTLMKLLASSPSQTMDDKKPIKSSGTDAENLRRLFEKSFRVIENNELFPKSLHLEITEPKHRENISIEFPDLMNPTEELQERFSESKKGDTYAMTLIPIGLFNYRLWCLATHSSLSGEPEIQDIELLFEAFKHDLRAHRREINLKFVKVALRFHPMLADVLAKLGIDMTKGKGKEVESGTEVEEYGEEQLPAYEPGWGRESERHLVDRMETLHLKGKDPAPKYEAGDRKH